MRIAADGFDAVWFMGVWERSPAGIAISMRNHGLLEDFMRALPDFSAEDNVGSPYCVRRYVVDEHLGGAQGLAAARKMLRERGVRLILDFVPNHVAPDHPWVSDHPEYFIQGNADDLRNDPASFVEVGRNGVRPGAAIPFSRLGLMFFSSTPFSPGSGKRRSKRSQRSPNSVTAFVVTCRCSC